MFDIIKKTILDAGFSLINEIELQLDENMGKSVFIEHSSWRFFSRLVRYMSKGPELLMVLEKANAIADLRALNGLTDARKLIRNLDSPQSADGEYHFSLRSHLQNACGLCALSSVCSHDERDEFYFI
ncbi:Probable nucleoside diphosphate kinase 5 [Striga hermonthica]|uniref:Probable nucleoside diphosphate kinase 5 n=1 Tax=Striga hermonthica TaxID=68872 RepID=A0A9N7NFA7_STRHE|nr:Probable nucleoside diphosphate kinase 5 [Striga hermonthica]